MTNWSSLNKRVYEEINYDLSDEVGSTNYQPNNKNKMTGHNLKMFTGLVIVFVLGGLQALKGGGYGAWAETLIPVLLGLEHTFFGRTE